MIPFIDSHAHLADPAFDGDREDVVARAVAAGAEALICIGETLVTAQRAQELAARHPGLLEFSAGVHPHDASRFERARDVYALRDYAAAGAVALGECGLDYHYDHAPRDLQRAAFSAHLELASELDLPVVVHTREAVADTTEMVADAGRAGVVGVLHCFTGPRALAEVALDVGWYVSFSGIVTFKRWADDDLVAMVPSDRLLVESDAPYLAPVPHRGKRNEPAWVARTVERLAAARGEPADAIGRQVTANARRLFRLASAAASE